MNAKVVLGKCPRSKDLYGIRIEECGKDWVRTWAFKVAASRAKREGYEEAKVSGTMQPTPEYPACPHCGERNVALCSCGKLFCWYEETSFGTAVCPWCEKKGEYEPTDRIEVAGGGL